LIIEFSFRVLLLLLRITYNPGVTKRLLRIKSGERVNTK